MDRKKSTLVAGTNVTIAKITFGRRRGDATPPRHRLDALGRQPAAAVRVLRRPALVAAERRATAARGADAHGARPHRARRRRPGRPGAADDCGAAPDPGPGGVDRRRPPRLAGSPRPRARRAPRRAQGARLRGRGAAADLRLVLRRGARGPRRRAPEDWGSVCVRPRRRGGPRVPVQARHRAAHRAGRLVGPRGAARGGRARDAPRRVAPAGDLDGVRPRRHVARAALVPRAPNSRLPHGSRPPGQRHRRPAPDARLPRRLPRARRGEGEPSGAAGGHRRRFRHCALGRDAPTQGAVDHCDRPLGQGAPRRPAARPHRGPSAGMESRPGRRPGRGGRLPQAGQYIGLI